LRQRLAIRTRKRDSVTAVAQPLTETTRKERRAGVAGNERLTATAGAALFVLLAIEGVTILRVDTLVALHVFVGVVLVPVAVVKIATTLFRFARYYTGDSAYVDKGAPPLVLRAVGPFVVVFTVAVFATGIALGVRGPRSGWLLEAHKASFIAWFAVTTVHVLGHLADTARLAVADWVGRESRVAGVRMRVLLIAAAIALGLVLALATRSWADGWHRFAH
jgi:hypothetical protein